MGVLVGASVKVTHSPVVPLHAAWNTGTQPPQSPFVGGPHTVTGFWHWQQSPGPGVFVGVGVAVGVRIRHWPVIPSQIASRISEQSPHDPLVGGPQSCT